MAEHNSKEAPNTAEQVINALAKRKKPILLVVLAIVVILAVNAAISYNRRQSDKQAADAVFVADFEASTKPEADAMQVFGAVAEKFKGMPAAAQAVVMQFAQAVSKDDFALAETKADEFIRTYPAHPFAPRMTLGKAQALLNLGKVADALPILNDLVSRNNPEVQPQARLAQAEAMLAEAELNSENKDAYRSGLEAVRDRLVDLVSNGRQNYWPADVMLQADFILVLVNDKLLGYTYTPKENEAPATEAGSAVTGAPGAAAAPAAGERVEQEADLGMQVDVVPAPADAAKGEEGDKESGAEGGAK